MRVIINRVASLGPRTGIGHYTAQLLAGLRRQAGDDAHLEVFPRGWVRRAGAAWGAARPRLAAEGRPGGGRFRPLLDSLRAGALQGFRRTGRAFLAGYFRAFCALRHYDLYHEPNFIPLPVPLPTVATLHDLSVLLHPEWHPRDRVVHFERHFQRGLARCAHFLAISEFGRQEVIRTLNIPPERVTRTYMGIRPGLGPMPPAEVERVLHELNLPPRYLLYLGTIEPRKNVLRLLQTYCRLPAPLRQRWPLLLVGGWGWNTGDVADYFQREARHRGVRHLGYVAEAHVAALYNGARALVYPSLYEGFGLPPIEMMACGGAVLASTASSLVETVGSRAHLVEPEDGGGWYDALVRVLTDDDWVRQLRQGTPEVARPFTWDACAADTLRVYRSLCGDAPAVNPASAAASPHERRRAG